MKFLYNIDGADSDVKQLPVLSGATLMPAGAVVIKGATAGTNNCFAIIGTGALADVLGVLEAAVLAATTDSAINGTALNLCKLNVNPFAVYMAEYSQATADTVAATSASSGTTVNLTSAANITGGYLYITAGPSAGTLEYVVSGSSNVNVTKTAFSPVLSTASYMVRVLPQFYELVGVTTDATKIDSTAADGSGAARVLDSFISYNGAPLTRLVPSVHSGLTGLNTLNLQLFSAIMFLDHAFNVSA